LTQEENESVRVFFGPPLAFFRLGRATLATRLLRGRFPDWRAALPGGTRPIVELAAEELLAGVRQAAVLRERVQPRLLIRLETGRLVLESRVSGTGSIRVERTVAYSGAELTVAFNPAYLLELLRALEGCTVRLELSVPEGPALFVTPDGYRHVLMPLRQTAAPDVVFATAGRAGAGEHRAWGFAHQLVTCSTSE
jgi:DNA polymerase-3 subunit beta